MDILGESMVRRRTQRRTSPVESPRRSRVNRRRLNTGIQNTNVIALDESCIDLTSTDDENFVDLTNSRTRVNDSPEVLTAHGANDQSVVVIETPEVSTSHGQRLRQIQNRLETIEVANDDDDDLPPAPFPIQFPPGQSTSTMIASPEPIKITCPICFDDDKTIKRSKRKLTSTLCGHVFCNDCIQSAVRRQNVCPICRKIQKRSDLRVLHI